MAAPSRIWLVRHGESDWNVLGRVQGQSLGPILTARGRQQAERVGRRLADQPVSAVYSSDLERARQSGLIIGAHLGVSVICFPALRERSLGAAEGGPSLSLRSESGIAAGRVVDADRAPTGGESVRDLYERSVRFVTTIAQEDGDVVLVTHGGVIRVLLGWWAGREAGGVSWPAIENGAIFVRRLPRPPGSIDLGRGRRQTPILAEAGR